MGCQLGLRSVRALGRSRPHSSAYAEDQDRPAGAAGGGSGDAAQDLERLTGDAAPWRRLLEQLERLLGRPWPQAAGCSSASTAAWVSPPDGHATTSTPASSASTPALVQAAPVAGSVSKRSS